MAAAARAQQPGAVARADLYRHHTLAAGTAFDREHRCDRDGVGAACEPMVGVGVEAELFGQMTATDPKWASATEQFRGSLAMTREL